MRTAAVFAICLTSSVGIGEEVATLRVVDLPRKGAQVLGRRVTVTDCTFARATATHVTCAPSSSANPGGPTLLLFTRDMPNETFDRLLRSCSQSADAAGGLCRGSATGRLDQLGHGWQLSEVAIAWEN
jgi:hypothetical protein